MSTRIDSSFWRLRCLGPDGRQLTRDQMRQELRKGDWIWDRWAKGFCNKPVRVAATNAGPSWSGAFFPSPDQILFNLHWVYPWGSMPPIFAHERGHQRGLWRNGQHPTGNLIMATGAPGVLRQLGYSEAQWAARQFGLGSHNFHPAVMGYHRASTKARKLYANYGARLREERAVAQKLRNKNKKVGLTNDELVRLNVANRVIEACVDERLDLSVRWCNWERTCDREVLSIARGYGSTHRTLLIDQRRRAAMSEVDTDAEYSALTAGYGEPRETCCQHDTSGWQAASAWTT